MSSNKTNLKNAIVDIVKNLESVFRKYSRQTREKAWERLTSKQGEKEMVKILNDPSRPVNTFQKLATDSFKEWLIMEEKIKIWLDDLLDDPESPERHVPAGFVGVKTAWEAIELLKKGNVEEISLDHDLGNDEKFGTGYDVAKFIEQSAFEGSLRPLEIKIHSANPVGRKNMGVSIDNAYRFWRLK